MLVRAVEVEDNAVAPSTEGADDGVRIGDVVPEAELVVAGAILHAGGPELGGELVVGVEGGAVGVEGGAGGGVGATSRFFRADGLGGRSFPVSEEGSCFLGLGDTRDVT